MRTLRILTISCLLYTFGAFGEEFNCPNLIMGDVSLNGKVNSADLAILSSFLVGLKALNPCQRIAADVDADSIITRGDLNVLRAFVVQLINVLPALYGDVTHNGSLSSLDTSFVSAYISGSRSFSPAQLHLADVNRDGVVDFFDQALISKAVVRNLPKLPIPK